MHDAAAPSHAQRRSPERFAGWQLDLGCTAVVGAVVTGALLWGGGIWEHVNSGDLHAMFVPWYEQAARLLVHEGRTPLWDPHQFCGTPVLGLGQAAVLYPPVLITFAVLPRWAALQALYAVHALVLTLGFIRYGHRHGIERAGAGLAALVTVAGVLRGPLRVGVDHPAFLAAVAWIPWLLYCFERALDGTARRWVACFAVVAALQWLAGYPDFGFDLAVLLFVVAVLHPQATLARRLATVGIGLALGAALAAVQLLPVAEAVAESPRVDTTYHALFRSMFAVKSLPQLGAILLERVGPGALALALMGLWRPLQPRVTLAWSAALVWAIFALNRPLRWLYLLPPFSGLRFPFGWSGCAVALIGLLAGAGLTTAWQARAQAIRVLGIAAALLAVGFGVAAVARAPESLPPFNPGSAAYRAPDLDLVATRVATLRTLDAGDTNDAPRVLSEREAAAGAGIRHGLPMANGHDPSLPPRRVVELLEAANLYDGLGLYRSRDRAQLAERPQVAAVLGIGVVVVPQAKAAALRAAGFTPVGTLPPDDVVLVHPAVPRARLVHEIVEAHADGALPDEPRRAPDGGTLDATLAPDRDPVATAVIAATDLEAGAAQHAIGTAGRHEIAAPPPGALEPVRIVEDRAEQVTIDVTAAAPGLLVLADTFYPGWRATVNGTPEPIVRVDHAFRGVWLAAGQHRVVFRYAPVSVQRGAAVSAVAAVIVLLCLAWPTGGRRERTSAATQRDRGTPRP